MYLALNRQQFPLFQTPLDLTKDYWKKLLKGGDWVIDATCGNGQDTLFLAKIVLDHPKKGWIFAMDKQQQALENTQTLLANSLAESDLANISFHHQCHSSFPSTLKTESITLIVYNLGYLPGGDKSITTLSSTTLQSLEKALPLILPGGAISITCYPGHETGKPEEEMIATFSASLNPQMWSCCHHRWVNRKSAPSLMFIQRRL